MNNIHIIVNPMSAGGKTERRWKTIKEMMSHYLKEFKYIFTEKPKQATGITRELIESGFDTIIGIGGDGTLNEIANGFFKDRNGRMINEDASMGIVPSGTGSDFIRYLKIPRDFKKSIELINSSRIKPIDLGRVTCFEKDEPNSVMQKTTKYFLNVADFGLGAEVVKEISSVPAAKRGKFCYYKGLLRAIKNYKAKKMTICLDDSDTVSKRFLVGAAANGGIFGGGMIIAPDARIDDGYFDVVLIEDMKKLELVFESRRLYTGTINKYPKVMIKRARKMEIGSDEPVNIEYDGEVGGQTPAKLEILEKCLNFRI